MTLLRVLLRLHNLQSQGARFSHKSIGNIGYIRHCTLAHCEALLLISNSSAPWYSMTPKAQAFELQTRRLPFQAVRLNFL
jgi:hypothetical protein